MILSVTMQLMITTVISLMLVSSSSSSRQVKEPDSADEEFCHYDTFRGRCWRGEVIVMTRALWGRMKTGRCVEVHPNFMEIHGNDPLFLGCFADVLSLADKKCSGKPECDIKIPDQEFENIKPCYTGLTTYFEASYRCVKEEFVYTVVQESRTCIVQVLSDQQFISALSSQSDPNSVSSCGSRSHPWRLEAPLGQRIYISLLDFAGSMNVTRNERFETCRQYGYVVDKSNRKNVTICAVDGTTITMDGANLERSSALYTSNTNTVDVVLVSGTSNNFLVSLQAVGCTNMIPPDNAWLKRSNNDIVIGCYLSQQTWQLKCDGHEWKGQVGTCPEKYDGTIEVKRKLDSSDDDKLGAGVGVGVLAIIAGAAIIICLTVIAIGYCCLKQYKQEEKDKLQMKSTLLRPLEVATSDDRSCPTNVVNFATKSPYITDTNGFVRLPIASDAQL